MNAPILDRRRFLVGATALGIPLLSVGAAEPNGGKDDQGADEEPKFIPPDWNLLYFFGGRELREIRVDIPSRKDEKNALEWAGGEAYQGYNPGEAALKGVVSDEKRLTFLSSCLSRPIVRAHTSGARHPGATGKEIAVGSVVFVCDKRKGRPGEREEVQVWLSSVGAMLYCKPLSTSHVFYSWGFAKVLDDFVFEQTKAHLAKGTFRLLSGEARIESEGELFEHFVNGKPLPGE